MLPPFPGCTNLLTKKLSALENVGRIVRQNSACRFEQLYPGLQWTCSLIRQRSRSIWSGSQNRLYRSQAEAHLVCRLEAQRFVETTA